MSDFKGTPGPWFVCDSTMKRTTKDGHSGTFDIINREQYEIGMKVIGDVKPYGGNFPDKDEAQANAKLIAAAPDMFADLKENHEFLLRMYNSINTYGNAVNLDQIKTDMRDRMAKQISIIEKATT